MTRAKPRWPRILLKLSGEAFAGEAGYGIDGKIVEQLASEIVEVRAEFGVDIAVVVGGGNIWRGMEGASAGMDRAQADYMGMLATVINSLALQDVLERHGQVLPPSGDGDVAKEWYEDVRHHPDGHAQRKPLRKRGDEPEIRMQAAAGVDVSATRARHGRGQHRVDKSGEQHGNGCQREGGQNVRTDTRHAALNHERDDVDARADHRADTRGHQAEQPHLAGESGPRRGRLLSFRGRHRVALVYHVIEGGRKLGAGNRDRTGDIQLGKLAFYR